MLKQTPKYLMSKALHRRRNLVEVKKDGGSKKIKFTWEKNTAFHCKAGELTPFVYYSQLY